MYVDTEVGGGSYLDCKVLQLPRAKYPICLITYWFMEGMQVRSYLKY